MSAYSEIVRAIRAIAKKGEVPSSAEGTVESVDMAALTCVVVLDDVKATLPKVQLRGIGSGGKKLGLVQVPAEGSSVRVGFGTGGYADAYVAEYGDLQKVLIYINGKLALVADEKLHLGQNDQYGGLVQVAALTQELNTLQQRLDAHIKIYNTHTHVASGFGIPTAPPVATDVAPVAQTKQETIENKEVLHGKV